ncbi:MAG: HlyC/CorC family transporter [Thermoleophilia bacterium]|nr:HlyC/CorC family transporter [Thermoleophilia bacterium]
MTSVTLIEIALIVVIIAWNAFFVSAEYAFVAVRRTRIDELVEEGSIAAKRVRRLLDDPARFISAFQVAITLSSLALGAVGEPAVSRVFEELFGNVGMLGDGAVVVISVILAFAIISSLHVVLGEIVPKTLTLSRAESVALTVVLPVTIFMWVFWPFIWVLRGISEALIRLMGLESPSEMRLVHSEEELKLLISASHEEGVLEAEERQLLYKVFDFAETEARQVMVPRPDVVALQVDLTPDEAIEQTLNAPYTRYPVYRENLDDLVGVVHIRHLFGARLQQSDATTLEAFVRPVPIVPETKKLDELLADFRRTNTHMAIVVDEYGSTVGIATLEDVLEEIVGEINDEFDVPDRELIRLAPDRIRIEASFPIEDFNERFAGDLPDEDYTSIGGFLFGELGRPARPGDVVSHQSFRFTVREVDGPRIRIVDVELKAQPLAGADEV